MRKAGKTGVAAALAVMAIATTAAAQAPARSDNAKGGSGSGYVEKREDGAASVIFDDDPMNAPGMDAVGVTLRVRGGPARFLLIKPRMNFLTELRKSVEAL